MNDEKPHVTPSRIGKYDILDVLGRGGMGVVYRARDARIGRDVAIKTLTEGFSGKAEMLKRFYQEAGHTGNLRHPNIVIIYDFGDENGLPYIVMEYLDGDPLDRLIRDNVPLHLSAKLDIIEQVCSALSYAHARGMVHRDVKPANIIVQQDGLAKLLDFGIARAEESRVNGEMTQTGTLVGTPSYMAPERLQGGLIDGRSDIFSVGVVLYQLLTGRLPFDAEYPGILNQILQQDPPPLSQYLSGYPPQLDAIVEHSLAKKVADRYASAGDMAADLNAIGAQLKSKRVAELVVEARSAVDKSDYTEAKQFIRQILRFDSHNIDAKKLNAAVIEAVRLQETRRRVDQLVHVVEEAIEARNWEHAVATCREGLVLEKDNSRLERLLRTAIAGQERKAQVLKFLGEAEAARAAGNFESATRSARAASELEPSDSKILAICDVLSREAKEQRQQAQLRELLTSVRDRLNAHSLQEAAKALAQAEELEPANSEVLRLKDEILVAIGQQQRKQLVEALSERVLVAATFEQIQAAMREIVTSLEKFPAEPTLLRLKMQLEPRFRDQLMKRVVTEINEACRHLSPVDALARVREGLVTLPGNPDLVDLESTISKRLMRERREAGLAEHLAKARTLLEDHLYLETVKVLELAEQEGYSSPEMTELLELARSTAAERVSQDLVERSFLEAKRLLAEQDYEAVIRILPPVLQRVNEPSLRRQLEEASHNQDRLKQRVEQILAEVGALCDAELFDSAIGLICKERLEVQRSRSIRAALQLCTDKMNAERTRLAVIGAAYACLDKLEYPEGFQLSSASESSCKSVQGTNDLEKMLTKRIQRVADEQLKNSVETAKQALVADDALHAEGQLQKSSLWLPYSSSGAQSEWTTVQTEIAAAKKVLRFGKVLRRRA